MQGSCSTAADESISLIFATVLVYCASFLGSYAFEAFVPLAPAILRTHGIPLNFLTLIVAIGNGAMAGTAPIVVWLKVDTPEEIPSPRDIRHRRSIALASCNGLGHYIVLYSDVDGGCIHSGDCRERRRHGHRSPPIQ